MFSSHFFEISIAFVLKLYSLNVIKKLRIESRIESDRIESLRIELNCDVVLNFSKSVTRITEMLGQFFKFEKNEN